MSKKIFETSKLGTMTLRNRLWRAAAWEKKTDDKGHMTESLP